MTAQHYEGKLRNRGSFLIDEKHVIIGEITGTIRQSKDIANAAHIALCWNSHSDHLTDIRELCEALQDILGRYTSSEEYYSGLSAEHHPEIFKAQSALAKHQPKDL